MNLTGEWMALPECDFALRYDGEELAIETVLQWHLDTELPKRCTSIELPSKNIDTNTAQLLSSIALQCRHLHTVDLSNNQIRDEGAMTLAESMKLLSREINYLDISGNLLTERSAGKVAEAFLKQGSKGHSEPTLPREGAPVPLLDLSNNALKDAGVQLVASHICSCVRLRLRNVGCGKEGVRALLQKKHFLAELDLGSNPIGKFGVYDLCTAIQSEIRWVSLNISYLEGLSGTANAEMSANLATPIKSCLSNSGLRDLDCSGNGLGDTGAFEVVEAIRDRDTFERLAMNNSGCGILLATVLKDVLAVRPGRALRVLELRGNALNDDCMRVFAKGLALSTSLEILILAENLITCPGVKSLAEGLKLQRRLEGDRSSVIELDLSGNALGIEAAEVLAEAAHKDLMTQRKAALKFEVPWGLEKLHLNNCQIHGDLLKVADAMLQRVLLLKEAAEAMSPEVVEMIKERRLRQPHSLEVLGLFEASDNDPRQFFEPIRLDAELKLKEKWPELPLKRRTIEPVPETVPETLPAATAAVAPKELPVAAPADSGVSTCTEIPVMRLDDDSDEEHSPYAEVDGGDDLFEGKCEVASVDASKHHRMDINDTPGSIRDLDPLDHWYDDGSPVRRKAITKSNDTPGSIRVLDVENWYDDGSPANQKAITKSNDTPGSIRVLDVENWYDEEWPTPQELCLLKQLLQDPEPSVDVATEPTLVANAGLEAVDEAAVENQDQMPADPQEPLEETVATANLSPPTRGVVWT